MNAKQIKIIEAVKDGGFGKMAEIIEEQFSKGFTIDEVWASLLETTDIIKDVVWKNRVS